MTPTQIRVVFILAEFPHYRADVLCLLGSAPGLHVEFFGSDVVREPTIPSMTISSLARVTIVKNRRILGCYWQTQVVREMLRGRYNVVIFLGDARFISTWLGAIVCRVRGIRVLYWTIGWTSRERGFKRLIRLLFYRLANLLLLYGETGQRLGIEAGYPGDRCVVIGNSVSDMGADLDSQGTSEPDFDVIQAGERTNVICVGRLTAVKRLDLLIRAVSRDSVLRESVTILFVGDGEERSHLESLAEEASVSAIFYGSVHDLSVLARLYERSRVTVVPGAAGLTVTQSLSFGTPVITHSDPHLQMPESEAVRPGLTGDLFAYGDSDALGETIRKWIDMDELQMEVFRNECRREVRLRWTPEAHAARIVGAVRAL